MVIIVILIVWVFLIPSEQKKLEQHKKVCKNKVFYYVIIPFEDTKIL